MKRILLKTSFGCCMAIVFTLFSFGYIQAFSGGSSADCPSGMYWDEELQLCIINGAEITCDITYEGKTEAVCWRQRITYPWGEPCEWTGMQTVCNTYVGW